MTPPRAGCGAEHASAGSALRAEAAVWLLCHPHDQLLQLVDVDKAPDLRLVGIGHQGMRLAVVEGAVWAQDRDLCIRRTIEPAFGGSTSAQPIQSRDRLLETCGKALSQRA